MEKIFSCYGKLPDKKSGFFQKSEINEKLYNVFLENNGKKQIPQKKN